MDTPNIFISYAWTNQDYTSWVLSLAERLMDNGVNVVVDKWNLELGQDKYVFMEKMVQDQSINHVLLMLNQTYKEKADSRTGGVGTEAQIISSDLYNKTDQTKFIPIITERDESGNEFSPVFLKNRIYVDLSDVSRFEDEYEKLLRLIFKRPQYAKPKIGAPPSYLFEDQVNTSEVVNKEKPLLNAIEKNDRSLTPKLMDYVDSFIGKLNTYRITEVTDIIIELGRITYEKNIEMIPLRDSFLNIAKYVAVYCDEKAFEILIKTYANIELFYKPEQNKTSSWHNGQFDNYSLFFYELIISHLAILLHYERWDLVKIMLSHVFLKTKQSFQMASELQLESIYEKFEKIYCIPEYYRSISGKNFYQPIVEILKQRVYPTIVFGDLVQADLLLHYYRLKNANNRKHYFPNFALYLVDSSMNFFVNLLYSDKLIKVITVFGFKSKEELFELSEHSNFPYDSFTIGDYYQIPKLTSFINYDLWGTK